MYQINTPTNGLLFFMAKVCVVGKLQQWRVVNYFRQFQVTVCTKGIISALIVFLKPEAIVTLAFGVSLKLFNYISSFCFTFLKHMFSLKNSITFLVTVLYLLYWNLRQLICLFHAISILTLSSHILCGLAVSLPTFATFKSFSCFSDILLDVLILLLDFLPSLCSVLCKLCFLYDG